jgi:arylsulfatase A
MKRRDFLRQIGATAVGTWFLPGARGTAQERTKKPNVIVLLADDLGYGSVGCYGANPQLVATPNIDRLAREGIRFTDANTPSSVCTPTRYGLLTGRYCWRSRLKKGVSNVRDPLLIETERPTLASLLKGQGYRTAMVGKWHLGYGTAKRTDFTKELKPGPLELGFDYQFAVPQNNGDMTGVYVENHRVVGLRTDKLDRNAAKTFYGPKFMGLDAPQRDENENMPVLTNKAVTWLKSVPQDTPFLLYFAATAVHEPITPSRSVANTSKAGPYTDFIRDLDRTVELLLAELERRGELENTLFLFTSDNGGVLPPPPQSKRKDRNPSIKQAVEAGLKINGDWRGRKHRIWEGGFRVPFLVRWPAGIKAGVVCGRTVGLVDTYATLAELVGTRLPDRKSGAEDSISFLPLLAKPDAPQPRNSIILHNARGVFAIRQGPWKYIEGKPYGKVRPGELKHNPEFRPQLYHLGNDPAEAENLIAKRPEVVERLGALLNQHRQAGFSRSAR